MAKKPLQHKIDGAAKRIFEEIFDEISWEAELLPEYGIDYRVQILDKNDNVTRDVFLSQLKGHRTFTITHHNKQQMIAQPLSVDRIADYLDVYKEPVFLVVVDTTHKEARYLFMQSYADAGLLPENWREQDTVRILVPAVNDLRDQTRFRKELDSAIRYMHDKYPGSPAAALYHAKKQYKDIDPRFDVRWETDGSSVSPHFIASAKMDLSVLFKSDVKDVEERRNQLFHTGLPIEFSCGEVIFKGSPLLEPLNNADKVTIQIGHRHKIFISIIRLNNNGSEVARLDCMSGELTAGQQEYHFEAALPNELLSMKAEHIAYKVMPSTLTLHFDVGKWKGLPVLSLPYYEQVYAVFGPSVPDELNFNITLKDTGKVFACNATNFDEELLRTLSATLLLISKLRSIANIIGANPTLKSTLTDKDIKEIKRIYKILSDGKRVMPCPHVAIEICQSKQDTLRIVEDRDKADSLTITTNETIDLFDTPIIIGTCKRHFTQVGFKNRSELISRLNQENDSEKIRVELEGTDECVLTETIELGKNVIPA